MVDAECDLCRLGPGECRRCQVAVSRQADEAHSRGSAAPNQVDSGVDMGQVQLQALAAARAAAPAAQVS